nr:non-ribosomal peptide synthetase [Streptomyces harenosi]
MRLLRRTARQSPQPAREPAAAGGPRRPGTPVDTHPLSESQRALWSLHRAYPDLSAYNVPLCLRVTDLDVPLFEEACRALVARHPVLTTVIHREGNTPYQSVDPAREPDFARVDLTEIADDAEALDLVRREGKRPFAMDATSPGDAQGLFRVRVFDRPGDESIVLITVHHVIFDGTSATLLLDAVFEAYRELAAGRRPAGAGGDRVAFHDFVGEERRALAGRSRSVLPYWRERLAAPLPVLDLPTERPHTEVKDRFAGATHISRVPAELAARVRELAARRRVFVSSVLLTAYAATLTSYAGQSELVVGMPLNERRGDGLAGAMGLLVNMLPVRVAVPPASSFARLVARAQREAADDMLHAHPFPALVRELAPEARPGRSLLFQTAFVHQDVLDGIAGPGRPYRLVEEVHQEGEYELSLEVWNGEDALTLYWTYQTELYARDVVEELADRFVRLLAAVCAEPEAPLADILPGVTATASQGAPGPRHGTAAPGIPAPARRADGAEPGSPELPGEARARQLAYWTRQLDGCDPQVSLPADRPRSTAGTYRGAREPFRVEREVSRQLAEIAAEHGTTLYTALLTACALLLHRYTEQTDLTIGTTLPGPHDSAAAGLRAGTQVIRADLSGDPAFAELLGRTAEVVRQARAHGDVPLRAVADALGLRSGTGRTPAFQVAFDFRQAPSGGRTEPGGASGAVPAAGPCDVSLELGETADGLAGALVYDAGLYDRESVRRFARNYAALLRAVVAGPGEPVSRLDGLDEAEQRRVLHEWNTVPAAGPAPRCVHEWFEEVAAAEPDAVAVECEGRVLSYGELNARANRLARHLRGLGAGPEVPVALCLPRDEQLVVCVLAVLKAGAAYVPLDPASPAERLAFVLEDGAPRVVVTNGGLPEGLAVPSVPVVDVAADAPRWAGLPPEDLPGAGVSPSNTAYVIYTSGSTGVPKGVAVEHRNVTRLFTSTADWFRFDAHDVWTLFHSFAFDFSVWEMWGALLHGGRLVIVPQAVTRDPHAFHRLLRDSGVTVLNQTPSAFRQLIAAQGDEAAPHALRVVIFGGEALDVASLKPWMDRPVNRETALVNMYGITETTVHVTYRPLTPADAERPVSPIGARIPDLRTYVLDQYGRPAPIGAAGELYVGGAGVARGYVNRPELTAERFVEDPFCGEPGARMYRTGDLARWRADGSLEYLGRNDDQVKIRGFRIEPGEIEARLGEHPAVASCAVLARQDQPGEKQLVAYVVPAGRAPGTGADGGPAELREDLLRHLRRTLPAYMVPRALVTLDRLPLTGNGKLDRKALPAPGIDAYAARGYTAPDTPTERILAAVWAGLTGLDEARIGTGDNFFELGGHSLLIATLIARLAEHGLHATVRDVFASPTLADLAARIDGGAPDAAGHEVPANAIPPGCARITPGMLPLAGLTQAEIDSITAQVPGGAPNVQDVYPLVPSQEGILFHHLMDPGRDPYVIPLLFAVPDQGVCDDFVAALQALVDRHDAMRTAVVTEGLSQAVQVVLREVRLDVERRTLDPDEDAERQARAWLDEPGSMRLDQAPLVRLAVAADPHSERRFLLFRVHHLIEDATSLRLIFDELATHMAGRPDRLAPAPAYRDFVGHTLHQLATNDAEAYFRAELADVTEPTTPFHLADVHGDGSRVHDVHRPLPAGLTRELRAQAQRLRLSPATLFHAAWALVAAAAGGRDDVVFGTVLSGRLQGVPGVERMLGNFINTLPLRVRLRDRSVEDLVSEVDAGLKGLIRHEQSALTLAQGCSGLDSEAALFSSLINYRYVEPRDGRDPTGLQDLGVTLLGWLDRTNYPVGVSVDDTGTALSLNAQVDTVLSPDAVLDQIETALSGLLAALAADDGASTRALDIDVVPPAQYRRELTEWNDTARPSRHDRCLAELFEEQVRARPDAIAVAHGDRRLTYAQTNARANRVAHYLRERGVGPDTLVGLCAERSPDLVIGLLGILKAGGAYVPIDPAYPRERIRAVRDGSGVRIVLGQSGLSEALLDGTGDGVPPEVVHLDTGERAADGTGPAAQVLAGRPEDDLSPAETGLRPGHLAYAIFTSGSTGRPKGVLVEQRGVARLVTNPDFFAAGETDVVLHHSSIAFDAGSQEVLTPLLNGGLLVLHDGDSKDPAHLLDTVERTGVTTMLLSAAFLPAFADAAAGRTLPLRCLAVVGDTFSARDVRRLYAAHPGLTVVNGYGPTENSIASTYHVIPADIAEDTAVPIGRPVPWSTAYVLDRNLRPLPWGAVGELCVGGAGVARGYLDDAGLTAGRFVPDPFSQEPGARLYRTGDLARRLPDGTLEFHGRVDDQVKVRGYRVEPGEIETVLHAHPAVHSAVVTTRTLGGTQQLVAHVRPAATWLDGVARQENRDRLRQWQDLFEDRYCTDGPGVPEGGGDPAQPADDLDLAGWSSSYTGESIPVDEMLEWIDGTVRRIHALRPRRLLEVGCGTGLLLFRYADACESVHAVDLSASALAGVRSGVERRGWTHVTLDQGDARSFTVPEGTEKFDTVVVNSVVQYFPNRLYLEEVVERLLPLVAEGGRILIGDVRNLDLFSAHVCAVERSRLSAPAPAAALERQVRRRRRQETELLVSPTYFARLPERLTEIGAVDIAVKRGTGDNEMLGYRYDVVLTKGAAAPEAELPWLDAATAGELRALLAEGRHRRFGVSGLTNPQIAEDVRVSQGLARWPGRRQVAPLSGGRRLSPEASQRVAELEAVLRYAEELGYHVAVTWSQDRLDGLDLLFARDEPPRALARAPYRASSMTNVPQIADTGRALTRTLKEYLSGRVPEYLVPHVFVALEELPLTPNGKVDKRALPAPEETDVHRESYLAPRSDLERTLCRLAGDVLELDRVGLQDTFLDLGGHSLLATRLTMRVKQETGRELSLQTLLSGATLGEMARELESAAPAPAAEAVPLLPGTDPETDAPLALQQSELWFLAPAGHPGPAYDNVQVAHRIIGPLDRDAYARAYRVLVERHAILRTGYVRHPDATVTQRVHDAAGFAVAFEKVAGERALSEWLRAERARPFGPEGRYMLRVHLLTLSEYEHIAVVTRPWGIFDGTSAGVLMAELDALYRALSAGTEPSLPQPSLQYADFARWQQRAVDDAARERQRAYWRAHLAGLPACVALETDYQRPAVKSYRGSSVGVRVPLEVLDLLRGFGRERGGTLYMTLLSAFAALLGAYTRDRDLAIGSPVTNRPRPELESVVGYFVNLLVMRLETADDQRFDDLLAQAARITAAAHEHKDVPFADLVAELVPKPDPAHSPLFQIMFNLVPAAGPAAPDGGLGGGLASVPVPIDTEVAKFDLHLALRETPTGLEGRLEYSTDLFARPTAQAMAAAYERLLLKIVTRPGATLAQLRRAAVDGATGPAD